MFANTESNHDYTVAFVWMHYFFFERGDALIQLRGTGFHSNYNLACVDF